MSRRRRKRTLSARIGAFAPVDYLHDYGELPPTNGEY
jgi:hypothetical protein